MHEVVVVGGSLAGTATAYHLARAGRRVLLLERSETHHRKACGEGLFPRGVEELRRLGLLDLILPHGALLSGIRFHAGLTHVEAPFGTGAVRGLGIQRTELDPRMLALAQTAGVEVRTGVAVQGLVIGGGAVTGVRTIDGDIPAEVVVGADGIGSRLRTQAGLAGRRRSGRYGISTHVRLAHDPGSVVDISFHDGYEVYITPVGGRVVNVAVLVRKRLLGRVRGDLRGWFQTVLAGHPAFDSTAELIDAPVAAGPFGARCLRPWRRNLVLVGDAAGFLDAISGEGMSVTLASARDCAAAVDDYLSHRDEQAFRRYSAQRRSLVRNSDLLARVSLALAAWPPIARLAVRHMAHRPESFGRLVAISAGELPLRALRLTDVSALLLGI